MSEVKTYALRIGTDEVFKAINTPKGDQLIEALKSFPDLIGVHPTDEYGQIILFKTKQARNEAVTKLKSIGFASACIIMTAAYVDEKYVGEADGIGKTV